MLSQLYKLFKPTFFENFHLICSKHQIIFKYCSAQIKSSLYCKIISLSAKLYLYIFHPGLDNLYIKLMFKIRSQQIFSKQIKYGKFLSPWRWIPKALQLFILQRFHHSTGKTCKHTNRSSCIYSLFHWGGKDFLCL